ncbi:MULTISPECIES: response regulator transcription factor [Idiomarina]|uniref:DNA-binding response regulator n=2 Tax=Idiomarina baltica TaxID=190892 RepID=A0A348WN93_9GAMM|nr:MULTISPECIES: response regulator transcription factor [Idiomarina]MAF74597.1 DNA-binding response regulator [Idiomarinaceae bacterium]EAQ32765.1 Response regulator, LuxR family protein (CheY, HTH domains) [Idiomarina baltica OS145]KXS35506.1 MAG: Response regulator, LuxR family protein (CheY, HTH domains) [Idiomarina sp. T82-3]MBL74926.1 DNA-binding response regulator [Idiomarinaceae bacterium]NQZ04309.1 response regulator transcription factor [Idiomarina sp.]|tara:strand:+ start:4770 stop:5366 length:597 start_codon:yes stop_codon:yes gene_type:complete
MKILLAEDQAMVRTALASLLRLDGEYDVDEAADGNEAINSLEENTYDLLLTDIEMPHRTGIDLVHWVKANAPSTKTVIITTFNRSGYVNRAVQAGVDGFLLKDAPVEQLMQSLTAILAGKRVIDSELLLNSFNQIDPLTEKERKALRLAADGLATSAIAKQLFIAEGTARNYLSEAIAKVGAKNRVEAARIAQLKGWL